jgi:hypothetical protein
MTSQCLDLLALWRSKLWPDGQAKGRPNRGPPSVPSIIATFITQCQPALIAQKKQPFRSFSRSIRQMRVVCS